MRDRLFGIGGGKRRHDGDLVGVEQPLDLDRIEPGAAVSQRRGNDLPRRIDIGRKFARHGGRNLSQRLHHLAMAHQMHEAEDGVATGLIVRNSRSAQQVADRLVRPDPDRQHGLRRHAALGAIFPDHTDHGRSNVIGTGDRRLDIHHQHGVVARVGQQHFERRGIARGVGIADDIDRVRSRPCRGQYRIELVAGRRRDVGGSAAEFDQPVNRQYADAAAIGQDRKPLSGRRFEPPERLGAVKQFAQVRYAQDAGALKGCVVDGVCPGQRAGMGCSRPRALPA